MLDAQCRITQHFGNNVRMCLERFLPEWIVIQNLDISLFNAADQGLAFCLIFRISSTPSV